MLEKRFHTYTVQTHNKEKVPTYVLILVIWLGLDGRMLTHADVQKQNLTHAHVICCMLNIKMYKRNTRKQVKSGIRFSSVMY